MRTPVLLALLSTCLTTPATTVAADDVAELVRQLDHRRYAVREAASRRLVALGPRAVDALLEAAEADVPELRYRARDVLAAIDWRPAAMRARLDGYLARGRANASAAPLRSLLAIGKPAAAHLKALLQPPPPRLSLRVEAPTLVTRGTRVTATATLTNAGPGGTWYPSARRGARPRIRWTRAASEPFVRRTVRVVFRGAFEEAFEETDDGGYATGRRGWLSRTWWPTAGCNYLAPGARVRSAPATRTATLGRLVFAARFRNTAGDPIEVAGRAVGARGVRGPRGEAMPDLHFWRGSISATAVVDVVPPIVRGEAGTASDGVRLALASGPTPRQLRVTLTNTGAAGRRCWPLGGDDGDRPLWFVAIHCGDDGRPRRVARWGAFAEVGGDARVDEDALTALAAGASRQRDVPLPTLPPGKYLVIVGLGPIAPAGVVERDISAWWFGELLSNALPVTVR